MYKTKPTRPEHLTSVAAYSYAQDHASALVNRLLAAVLVDNSDEQAARVLSDLACCGGWPGLDKALACALDEPTPAEIGLARVVVLGDESDSLD